MDRSTDSPGTASDGDALLRKLVDRAEIEDCLHRYSRGLDRRDWNYLASCYHDDATESRGEFSGTAREFLEWLRPHFEGWDHSLHVLDLNNIEIQGDVAYTECYVVFTQRRADSPVLDFGGARYLDRLERRNGVWKIAHRSLVGDWMAVAETSQRSGRRMHAIGTLDATDPSYSFKADNPVS